MAQCEATRCVQHSSNGLQNIEVWVSKKPIWKAKSFRTRQSSTGRIRQDETFRCNISLKSDSMRYRGAKEYNRIPADIINSPSLETFKKKLRQWVKMNVDLV